MNKTKIPSDIILRMNEKAKKAEREGKDITNITIGMMYLDDGTMPIPNSIKQVLSQHTKDADFEYSSVGGSDKFNLAIRRWFFEDFFEEDEKRGNIKSIATIGGTGSLTIAIERLSTKSNPLLLIPSPAWPNYTFQAELFNLNHVEYSSLGSSKESLVSLLKLVDDHEKSSETVGLLLNDPCQNPTGYCMTQKEWDKLISCSERYGKKLFFIIDLAYFDFAKPDTKQLVLRSIKRLSRFNEVYLCLSFSKTFSFYGLRIGSLAVLSKDSSRAENAIKEATKSARVIWSTPNHVALNSLTELLTDKNEYNHLKNTVRKNREVVAKRFSIFLEEAKKEGLLTLPYVDGFFLTIPCQDAMASCSKLSERGIFLAPISDNLLRIALCCVPTAKVYGLAKAIKEAI